MGGCDYSYDWNCVADEVRLREITKTARLQTLNLAAFVCMFGVNMVSTKWGASYMGFPHKLINHQTCGSVAHVFEGDMALPHPQGGWKMSYNDTESKSVRIMAAAGVWKVLFPLYAWLGVMVFLQLLPHEVFTPDGERKHKRDKGVRLSASTFLAFLA